MWANCPLQWKLRYIDGFKSDSGIELVFGTSIHDTVQHWLTILYSESPLRARTFDMHAMFKERFMELVVKELFLEDRKLTNPKEMAEYYADGCLILDDFRKYAKDWFPKTHQLVGCEVPLEVMVTSSVKFRGFLDVVLYHKAMKTLYIYDFKTSRFGWSYQKKDPKKLDQLLIYKKYYSKVFSIPIDNIKVEFIILKRKIPENTTYLVKRIVGFEPSNGTVSMKRADERFSSFLAIFDDTGTPDIATLHATPSDSACKYCPFRNDETKCDKSFYLPNNKRKITKKP